MNNNKLLLIIALVSVRTASVLPIAASIVETPVTYIIERGTTAIKFDNGTFSPDVSLSTCTFQLITWLGGGTVSLVISLISSIGTQTATVVIDVVKTLLCYH